MDIVHVRTVVGKKISNDSKEQVAKYGILRTYFLMGRKFQVQNSSRK